MPVPADIGVGPGADCLAALEAYAPADSTQVDLRRQFLAHLARHPDDGWSRTCPGAHLTASGLICSPDADQVLLLHHRKLGRWLQVGGHIEPTDTTLAGAAYREALEESGLPVRLIPGIVHLDSHEVPCGPVRSCFHLDVRYLLVADPRLAPVTGDESHSVRWFPHDALPTDESSVTVLVDIARSILV
ncbi:NUDIX hydrolase [Ammonicoccus fulvus]|uniref:NUDIX hydrolase n=1 Tax=Ammonicoccus fulvus TaxID=3138240 RepID=A0ABZ3FRP7_9ACTN